MNFQQIVQKKQTTDRRGAVNIESGVCRTGTMKTQSQKSWSIQRTTCTREHAFGTTGYRRHLTRNRRLLTHSKHIHSLIVENNREFREKKWYNTKALESRFSAFSLETRGDAVGDDFDNLAELVYESNWKIEYANNNQGTDCGRNSFGDYTK